MKKIIEEASQKLKSRVEELAKEFLDTGLSPQSLTRFELDLHESLGEMARNVEKALLEESDIEKDFIENDGLRYYWKYRGPQEYQCFFGKIEVERSVYQANGERSICPLEMNAGILHHHLTPLAVEFVAYNTAHMVPGELSEHCRRWQYMKPCETVIKQVAGEVGEMAELLPEIYEERILKEEKVPEGTEVVVISRDAAKVNIRDEGWRDAQVGSISSYGPMKEAKDDEEEHRERIRSVYLGQMPEEKTPSFNKKFEREIVYTLKKIPQGCRVACIADGSLSIWKYFQCHPELKNAVHINDFHHAAEHLSDVSHALFGEGTKKAESWFKKYRHVLKTEKGGVEKVIRSIRYFKNHFSIRSKKRREAIREGIRYFCRNRSRMQYSKYRRKGLPIGSGVIEAACKTVITQRFKRAGMRWSIHGAQSILNLRTLLLSRRWDSFWKHHEEALSATRIPA